MTNDLYRTSYRHLGVEPGSSWQEVRQAYKRCVKKWHPDHFHNDAKTQSIATEKIKEINCAFDLLSKHYQAHGTLPQPWEPLATSPPDTESAASGASEPVQRPVSNVTDDTVEHNNQPPVEEKKHIGAFSRLVFVMLIGWLGYTLWQAPDGPTESPVPVSSEPPAGIANPVVDAANRNQPESAQPKHYFTYGSTIGDVYAIQGIPTKTADNLWYYGNSKVYFSGGKVTKWEDDPVTPLNANADMPAARITNTAFGVGSTKAQVRVIQGEPLREWPNVWEYGTSKVYFDGDHVSGWYDSTLNPLQVHK